MSKLFGGVVKCYLSLALFPALAQAEFKVSVGDPYEVDSKGIVYGAYIPGNADASDQVLIDKAKGFVNFADTGETLTFKLNTESAIDVSSGKELLVQVFVKGSGSGSEDGVPIPIKSINGSTCSSSRCQGEVTISDGTTSTTEYLTGVLGKNSRKLSDFTVEITPNTVCAALTALYGSFDPSGDPCNGSNIKTPTAASATGLEFKIAIAEATPSDEAFESGAEGIKESSDVSLQLFGAKPGFECTPTAGLYNPGDGSIFIKTKFDTPRVSGAAEATHLVVMAMDAGTVDESLDFGTANSLVKRVELDSGRQEIKGFTNTTDGADHAYNIKLAVRDRAGIISARACEITGVQTSSIDGFLNESSCFIATGVFRNGRHPAVMLLREFREGVLRETRLGRAFIAAYETLSPPLARWIYWHETARAIAYVLLLPIIALVWLWIHFGLFGVLGASLVMIVAARALRAASHQSGFIGLLVVLGLGGSINLARAESYLEQEKKKLEPRDQSSVVESVKKNSPKAESTSFIEETKNNLPPKSPGKNQSVIQVVKSGGGYELTPNKGEPPRWRGGFDISVYSINQWEGQGSVAGASFDDVYGLNWFPEVRISGERLFGWESVGQVGLLFTTGLSVASGNGKFEYLVLNAVTGDAVDVTSTVDFTLVSVPVLVGASVHFSALHWVRFFGSGAAGAVFMFENRSDSVAGNRAYSWLAQVAGGVDLMFDSLFSESSWDLYGMYGIKHYYLTAQFVQSIPLGGDVNLLGSQFTLGLTYEF